MTDRAGRWPLFCRWLRLDHAIGRGLAAAALLLALPIALMPPAQAHDATAGKPQTGLKTVSLVITSGRREHHYRVEVAQSAAQQATGMMFRTTVPPATGMIFPMQPPRQANFWMRNTLVPLDLLFIGADGRIRNIIADAVPHSEAPLSSLGDVAAVLELAGGEAARTGIQPGDKVRW